MDEEERMRERNRIQRAKKHRRVREIKEEYSGDESNCELSEILMILRTPLKTARKGPVPDQPSCWEHNQTSVTFLAGSWSDSPTGSRLQLGLSVRVSISFRVRFPHGKGIYKFESLRFFLRCIFCFLI